MVGFVDPNVLSVVRKLLIKGENHVVHVYYSETVVEQHHMVPFHHRFLNTQFKEEENIQQMKERLITRAESSNHWLNELVQELALKQYTANAR